MRQLLFLDLERASCTCKMLILPNRIRQLTFFALLCVAWFTVTVGKPAETLGASKKTVLVLYREPSLWEQHPRLILATAAILVLPALLIVELIVQRSKLKRTEGWLRDSE